MIKQLLDKARGFDTNTTITKPIAEAFAKDGYEFVFRYIRRTQYHDYDLTLPEVQIIHEAMLGIGLVQHVANPGWVPSATIGYFQGNVAVAEAQSLNAPPNTTIVCDLEEVNASVDHEETIQFCNQWHNLVTNAGFKALLYVGDSCGLTSTESFYRLNFDAYWGAYNLNRYDEPLVRGLQMKQYVSGIQPAGISRSFKFQVDLIRRDTKGGTPFLWFADG